MKNKIIFPRAFAFAVDDLGWNEGSDLSNEAVIGPFRVGINRTFTCADYECFVEVGKTIGTRIQCLFILSEMDRENILAKFPTTTYQRDLWDNSHRVNEHQKEIMNYVRDHAAYMEFGMHGTGHEYWDVGEKQKRAEWYNHADKQPWPEQSIQEHIMCFKNIMQQYGFTEANGHSFPESFVPCAYSYFWNPTGEYSLGKLLAVAGVKYANTDFEQILQLNPPTIEGGGFDYGVHVINRINYGNIWCNYNCLPSLPVIQQETDIIESHWANWLAEDRTLQGETTKQWIKYYRTIQQMEDRYVAKNTEQLHSQWLYYRYVKITTIEEGKIEIDASQMPNQAYDFDLLGNIVLKVRLNHGEHVQTASLGSESIASYLEDGGFGFIYLPIINKCKTVLTYLIGKSMLTDIVYNDGTYNIYKVHKTDSTLIINLKIYGTQRVRIRCKQPINVQSKTIQLKINNFIYDSILNELVVEITAQNMQGSRGEICIII